MKHHGFPRPLIDHDFLEDVVDQRFPSHPFGGLGRQQLEGLFSSYLQMSTAFPYLMGAAHKRLYDLAAQAGRDLDLSAMATKAVGAFLTSDETGVWARAVDGGYEALPEILDTAGFHAELLRQDLEGVLGAAVVPTNDTATAEYLDRLFHGLSSSDSVTRGAMLASFELHAERMITALWDSIESEFEVDKDELEYFRTHVGGDDPAEAYHVAMTQSMLQAVVPLGDDGRFVVELLWAYQLHIDWCASIAYRKAA